VNNLSHIITLIPETPGRQCPDYRKLHERQCTDYRKRHGRHCKRLPETSWEALQQTTGSFMGGIATDYSTTYSNNNKLKEAFSHFFADSLHVKK